MAQPRTLVSIQYLRGLAALAVVAMHMGWTRTTVGAAGVDLFFVISGFIIVLVGVLALAVQAGAEQAGTGLSERWQCLA